MLPLKKSLLLILLINCILISSLYLSLNFTSINCSNKEVIEINSSNDISSAKITCYLHLKTTQVQLDITFLGTESSISKNSFTEEVSVFGSIRNVMVIESDYLELIFDLLETDNSTIIQFYLSSDIPVGFTRNVKISFIQDTYDFVAYYNYFLKVSWFRGVGNQNVIIIFDKDLSLLNCKPTPHSISSINNKLVLSWTEVNKFYFQANINYTSTKVIDELIITPAYWNFGLVKTSINSLTKVFEFVNYENQLLEGTIVCPEGVQANITDIRINIDQKIYIEVTIDISQKKDYNCNITINFPAAYPLYIEINGTIMDMALSSKILLGVFSILLIALVIFGYVFYSKRNKAKKTAEIQKTEDEIEEIEEPLKIELGKWKEILTAKEYLIFEKLVIENKMVQAKLCHLTSLSKSTVSRAVGRLEAKGLVKKARFGMSNIVELNRDFFKNNNTKKNA